jgi:hypothetical protein
LSKILNNNVRITFANQNRHIDFRLIILVGKDPSVFVPVCFCDGEQRKVVEILPFNVQKLLPVTYTSLTGLRLIYHQAEASQVAARYRVQICVLFTLQAVFCIRLINSDPCPFTN